MNLQIRFSEERIANLVQTDKAGLTTTWALPNLILARGRGPGGNRRGHAVALNPAFPLANEVRILLRRVAKTHGIAITSDLTASETSTPPSARSTDLDLIFNTRLRTRTLAALWCLGGKARSGALFYVVPDESCHSVKLLIRKLVEAKILQRADGVVSFAASPWKKELFSVLRRYTEVQPDFAARVRTMSRVRGAQTAKEYLIFGKAPAERVLCALAQGPMSPKRLAILSASAPMRSIVGRLEKMGIATTQGAGKGVRLISLNEAHPIHAPLRECLLSIADANRSTVPPSLSRPLKTYSLETLFGTELRLHVLIALHLAGESGIDGSDLWRMFPTHDRRTMAEKMWDWYSKDMVRECQRGHLVEYSLNPNWRHYEPLKALLEAIVQWQPRYLRKFATREKVRPPGRQAFERNEKARRRRANESPKPENGFF